MRRVRKHYPGISKAALEMALDNGGINRFRAPTAMYQKLAHFMDHTGLEPWQLREIDRWLLALSDDDLMIATGGEETEMLELMRKGPPFAHKLLNDMFEAGIP